MTVYYNDIDPFCCRVLRARIADGSLPPGDVDERSIEDVTADDLRGYDQVHLFAGIGGFPLGLRMAGVPDDFPIWTGGFPCFPAGTLILTKRGLVDISEVNDQDEVLTHRNRWRRVVRHHGAHAAPTVLLRGHGHPAMVTTGNHPFWSTVKQSRSTRVAGRAVRQTNIPAPSWAPAASMRGRFWATPEGIPSDPSPSAPSFVKDIESFYWCLGRWLADGWVVSHRRTSAIPQGLRGSRVNSVARRVLWCSAHHEAATLTDKLASAGIRTTRADGRTAAKFVVQNAELFEFLRPFGKGAAAKTVPVWILAAPEHLRAAFLEGYRTGDGNEMPTGWKATTVSKAIAIGVRLLAVGLGWSVALHKDARPGTCEIEGRTVRQRATWQLVAHRNGRSSFQMADCRFGLVRSVTPTGRDEEVFNFEVQEDNSYVADGIVVHNCQDISVAGRGAGLSGSRSGLFWELVRTVRLARPRWLLLENVAALLGRGMGDVASALAAIGYDSEWDCIPASAVGAPHRRDRVWIVGYPNGAARQGLGVVERQEWRAHPEAEWASHGMADARHGHAPNGDAGAVWAGRAAQQPTGRSSPRDLPHPSGPRLAIREGEIKERAHAATTGSGWWATERGLDRVVTRVSDKVDRRKRLIALGNAVVPQVVEVIGRAILAAEGRL